MTKAKHINKNQLQYRPIEKGVFFLYHCVAYGVNNLSDSERSN